MQNKELADALNVELGGGSPYRFVADRREQGSGTAILTHGDRDVAVHSAAGGGYRCTFWWKGRQQAHGTTAEISSVAGAACLWADGAGLSGLSAGHPFVEYSGIQLAYERGDAVELQWRTVLQDVEGGYQNYRELVILASEEPVLRRRFPRLGHRFVLSENEYSKDALFSIFLIRPGWFASFTSDGSGFEFEGTARDVVAIMTQAIRTRGAS
jgi:hypothetical protein